MCDRVGVLYAGQAGRGRARRGEVFDDPRHPYTVGLLRCMPARRPAQGPAAGSTRSPASCRALGRRPAGLRVRRPLRAGRGPLPHRAAAAVRRSAPAARSRCHFHERAQTLPRETAAESPCRAVDATTASRCCAPTAGEDVPPVRPRRARAGRRLRRDLAGRDAGPGRRVRQRQDDARARAARHHAARRGRRARARRAAAAADRPASGRRSRCARCRSSSRTPTRRSTAGTRCGGSSAAR